jgi:hypothetical protein
MTSFLGSPFIAASPFWGLGPKDVFLRIGSQSETYEPSLPEMGTRFNLIESFPPDANGKYY